MTSSDQRWQIHTDDESSLYISTSGGVAWNYAPAAPSGLRFAPRDRFWYAGDVEERNA